MNQQQPRYLLTCLDEFPKVSKARWQRPFDLMAIEKDIEHLQHARTLTYEQLEYFTKQDHWWFNEWWMLPPKDKVDEAFKDAPTTFYFWQLTKKNEGKEKEVAVINGLFKAFKSIEMVSIILRFIRPDSYGIFSPPTERILNTRRGNNAVETYLHYLDNLRQIRDNGYGLDRVADVDMALWVLHAKCFDETLKDQTIQDQFEQDTFMTQLITENLFDPLAKVPLPRLAESIQKKRSHLAGLVGCHFFELELRKFAAGRGVELADEGGEQPKLCRVIEALKEKKIIDENKRRDWHRLRKTRNDLLHEGVVPEPELLNHLVKEALALWKLNGSK